MPALHVCIYKNYQGYQTGKIDSLHDKHSGQYKVSQNALEMDSVHRICLLQRYSVLFKFPSDALLFYAIKKPPTNHFVRQGSFVFYYKI